MQLTNVLLASAKSKIVMVLLRSTGSCHKMISFREKSGDKLEIIRFDPYVAMECVYKEEKKIRTLKRALKLSKPLNASTYGIIPEELLQYDVADKKCSTKHFNTATSNPVSPEKKLQAQVFDFMTEVCFNLLPNLLSAIRPSSFSLV